MLLFSEYLRELIQAKKWSVSALSRISGVERTAISRALTGQRVLPYDALDALIDHLRLSPSEEQRLRACYDTQFEREGLRRSRELVGRLLSDLVDLDFSAPPFEETRLLVDLEGYAGGRSIFSGATNVQPLLRMVLSEELRRPDAAVDLTVPPSDIFLNAELRRRYLDGARILRRSAALRLPDNGYRLRIRREVRNTYGKRRFHRETRKRRCETLPRRRQDLPEVAHDNGGRIRIFFGADT